MFTTTTTRVSSENFLFDSNFSKQVSDSRIENSAPHVDSESSNSPAINSQNPLSQEDLASATITLRSLVSSKEAGVIIGKNGKNVADIREQTGVKAGVSKSAEGVQERVLTITGTLDGISKAYATVASTLLESSVSAPHPNNLNSHAANSNFSFAVVRLLISHHQMGTIIGRQGLKIKEIQEHCKVRMVASKQFLPNSTERIVEVQGKPEAIQSAIWDIGRCLLEETDGNTSTIYYNPQPGSNNIFSASNQNGRYNSSNPNKFNNGNNINRTSNFNNTPREDEPIIQEQMAISADMVGCIIGRRGAKIAEIRRESGAKISIAKEAHDASGDRMFTISGTKKANERAFKLLFNQLENEKNRRALEIPQGQQQNIDEILF